MGNKTAVDQCNRKKNTLGEKVPFRSGIKWLQITRFGFYDYKETYDLYTPFKRVCILKNQNQKVESTRIKFDFQNLIPMEKHVISTEKLNDIRHQLRYIPPDDQPYYRKVLGT